VPSALFPSLSNGRRERDVGIKTRNPQDVSSPEICTIVIPNVISYFTKK